jgi:hypothetical protein
MLHFVVIGINLPDHAFTHAESVAGQAGFSPKYFVNKKPQLIGWG